ncbi:MAG: RluA family pseudouridine synthase, partial [Lachnospiraceae bacterium]|nr:RluA family pseudouridine synthase [Lachnospiraceae bacterium]
MREFKVEKSEDGIRLNRYLRNLLPNMKDSVRHKLLRKNYFKVNGVKATGDEVLKTGDRINIYLGDETFEKFAKQIEQKIVKSVSVDKNDILYEDENVIIYNKAAGILSQGDKSNEQSVNTILNNYLRKKDSGKSALLFKPSVVNRLDRNTSGIIIFAKTNVAAREISNAIRNGELEKHYKAVVNGNVESEQGELVNLLKKDEGKN